jgi:predicted nuclease with RNAse H fold
VLTVGVDLAAEPERTAVAGIEWCAGRARVCALVRGADDDAVVDAVARSQKAGIDCPLGWPDKFVAFVAAHRAGHVAVRGDLTGREWRRLLTLRLTDRVVHAETGLTPLSVAADRIGHVALRCAGLLALLAGRGVAVDRSGTGTVAEVYPSASLKSWGLPHRGYKRPADVKPLGELVDRLLVAAPWLDLGGTESLCRRSHDAVDAVVAALTARAVSLNLTSVPAAGQEAAARTEGWIAVPTAPLDRLP